MDEQNTLLDKLKFGADLCGILNIAKPSGCTSRDVVNKVQRALPRKTKVGHAGTLDPMADGVLLVCVGKATRLMPLIHRYSKTYLAEFTLGSTSDTDDSTGEVMVREALMPAQPKLQSVLLQHVGTFPQIPPAYSAVKVDGKRAYRSAREGKVVEISPRPVTVHRIDLLQYTAPTLQVRIDCASGTYIRSIARDVGESLGVGGLMSRLTRENIGPFLLQDAIQSNGDNQHWVNNLQGVDVLFADFARQELKAEQLLLLKDGKRVLLESKTIELGNAKEFAAFYSGRFAALLQVEEEAPQGVWCKASVNWVPGWFQN